MSVTFISLASGSSGNCYYLGYGTYGILVDAGIGIRTIKKRLQQFGIDISSIRGVLVTHDHADHIKSVGHLGEKLHIPVFTTVGIHQGISKAYSVTQKLSQCVRFIHKGEAFHIFDFSVEAFEVPHDGTDNVGYYIEVGGLRFVFATDLGAITDTVASYLCRANYLILEANYDDDLLACGRYPEFLKQRISGETGHLSNAAMSRFVCENLSAQWRHLWLCHLSKDNNTPDIALQSLTQALDEKKSSMRETLQITVLQRTTTTGPFVLLKEE